MNSIFSNHRHLIPVSMQELNIEVFGHVSAERVFSIL